MIDVKLTLYFFGHHIAIHLMQSIYLPPKQYHGNIHHIKLTLGVVGGAKEVSWGHRDIWLIG